MKTLISLLIITAFTLISPLAFTASLNQAAWVPNTSTYKFGYNSIPNIRITKAPKDTDWNRWAMLHDGNAYRLYFFKKGSNQHFYQFAFNRSKNAYEYAYNNSIPVLTLVGAPGDADYNSFAMLHDGKDYRFYLKKRGDPTVLYQFAWVPGTTHYKFGFRSIPRMDITGFPRDTDWTRWQMLHDGKAYRLYGFKSGTNNRFYQGSFKRASQDYEYAYNSIPILNLQNIPGNSNTRSAAMLHDGRAYRFYFKAP